MITLTARQLRPISAVSASPFIGRISESAESPDACSPQILLSRTQVESLPTGFRAHLLCSDASYELIGDRRDVYVLGSGMQHLSDGDVVRIDPAHGRITALYRRESPSNSFLLTERCDNYCVMCSQPPKANDDSWLVDQFLETLPLISKDTREIGLTGGEPALLGDRLIGVLGACKAELPLTAVHLLSNGRRFAAQSFAAAVGSLAHPDLVVGIPLYSDLPEEHDFVVQAHGAFNQTVRGILNLKRAGVRVELRFVVHRQTYERMPEFAQFVSRNLRFVDHVAFMGLEQTGFAKANLDELWIDPLDYQDQLRQAVVTIDRAGMVASIYNHQLCVLP